MARRMVERSSKDVRGRSCSSAASGGGVKEIVERGTERPCWTRMGSGVPSCETCTASIAGRRDVPTGLEEEEGEGEDLKFISLLRYREDDDGDDEVQIVLEDAGLQEAGRASALRSTPKTIFRPDG